MLFFALEHKKKQPTTAPTMLIFKDIFTDEELLSDSYDIETIDGVVLKVTSKLVQKKENEDFGISANVDEDAGEGATADGADSGVVTVNMVVDAFKLQEQTYPKKDYMAAIKGYMAKLVEKLKEKNPDRVEDFKKGASKFVGEVLKSYDDWQFFLSESYNTDGMIVLQKFGEDGMTPYLYYFKDGLVEEKV